MAGTRWRAGRGRASGSPTAWQRVPPMVRAFEASRTLHCRGPQGEVPVLAAAAPPGNLSDMQIHRHPRPLTQELWGGPVRLVFTSPPLGSAGWVWERLGGGWENGAWAWSWKPLLQISAHIPLRALEEALRTGGEERTGNSSSVNCMD